MKTSVSMNEVVGWFLSIGLGLGFAVPISPAGTSTQDDSTLLARHCLRLSEISSGVCSVLGCDDRGLPLAVARSGGFFVHSQDPRADHVAAARNLADEAGLFGTRVVVEQGDFDRLPFAQGTVDLVLAVNLDAERLRQISAAEILRALRPEGKAILGAKTDVADRGQVTSADLRKWLDRADIKTSSIVEDSVGLFATITRPPLEGVDTWSHWEHGPDNNPVSTDAVIKAPYMTQWLGLPLYIAMPAITTSSGGRLFIAMGHIAHHRREEPWLNTILARSAYNGTVLWKKKLPDGYLVHRSAFIATEETFFLIDPGGSGCLMLDAETGEEQGKIKIPAFRGKELKWIAMHDGVLFALAGEKMGAAETTVVRSQQPHWSWGELSRGYYEKRVPWGFGGTLAAYDLQTEKVLWTHLEERPIDSRAMVMGGAYVFFYGPDSYVGCLDAKSGDVIWTNDNADVRRLIEEPGRGLSSTPGFRSACFSLYTPDAIIFEAQTRMNVVAVSTKTGSMLWQRRKTTNNPNIIFTDNRIYAGVGEDGNTLAIDPLTGEVLEDLGFKKRSCARLTATPDSFFCRGFPEGLTRYDRKTGKVLFNGAFRPSCNDGVVPANGMLYVGPWACDCNLSVMGRVALCSAESFQPSPAAAKVRRFEQGHGDRTVVEPFDLSETDWPTNRGNRDRSASSAALAGGPLSGIWQFDPRTDYRPTTPTSAGDLIFLGGDDGKVRALDAATGKLRWSFLTAGPIAQPPTIDHGRAYVGSGDGYVYTLEAATGRLLWRFRIAPIDRRIMVYGSLCSTWPVNSGVLVDNGVAYAAAGIVDYDGTYVCALDAETGQLKWLNDTTGHLDPTLRKGVSAQGTLTIAGGRLWLAGGNIVSPAAYDLETGNYLSGPPGDGSPRSNRGEEVAAFRDRYVVLGGRLRYSAVRNVVNPGSFAGHSVQLGEKAAAGVPINVGKIAPAWDDEIVALVNGRDAPPECYSAAEIEQYLDAGDAKKRPSPRWTAEALRGSDTVSIAIASDAVLTVCSTPKFRSLQPNWRLCAVDRDDGAILTQQNLPSEALPGGLLVGRDGRIVVVLQNGSVACFGGPKSLEASIKTVTKAARSLPDRKDSAVQFLRHALAETQSATGRALLLESLEELGVHVTDEAAKNGRITQWHLIGHVPWDGAESGLDQVVVEEPEINLANQYQVGKRTLRWRDYVTTDPHGTIDLVKILGPPANVAAYGYTEVELPTARNLTLHIGSNDGFKCWFNGSEVARFAGGRSYVPDQDEVAVKAKKGVNTILMKVTQMGGAWAFSVRLTDPKGEPINLAQAGQ